MMIIQVANMGMSSIVKIAIFMLIIIIIIIIIIILDDQHMCDLYHGDNQNTGRKHGDEQHSKRGRSKDGTLDLWTVRYLQVGNLDIYRQANQISESRSNIYRSTGKVYSIKQQIYLNTYINRG